MRNVWTIFTREIKSFYVSPLFYLIGIPYLVLTAALFNADLYYLRMPTMENSIRNIGFFSMLFLSILCMKLVSEEKNSGTFEIIMTSPITSLQYVVGKYLSVLVVYLSLLVMTLAYPIFLMIYGTPDIGVIFSGYLGLFLFGSAILGLGLIATCLSRSQLVAAILGVSFTLVAYIVNWFSGMFAGAREVFNELSIMNHFEVFTLGVVDMKSVLFLLIWVMVCVTTSTIIVESYKW